MKQEADSERYSKLVARLPITFRPFVNEKLTSMERLFSYERKSIEAFLLFIENLNPGDFELLFLPVRTVEKKMGVERWIFSSQAETLENTSLLAHSPYYQEWRQAVQGVFDEVTSHTQMLAAQSADSGRRRLIVIVLPRSLPVKMETVWSEWSGEGRQLPIVDPVSSTASWSEILLGEDDAGLLGAMASTAGHSAEDLWVLDAGSALSKSVPAQGSPARDGQSLTHLSYTELVTFREAFRDRLNWIQKDLGDADKVIADLRHTDVTPWCPETLKSQIATREFVKDLFLSGNGSVVFGNAFVQWAANEAFRRARPRVMVACFGTRNKPKAFTSIAILEDQERTSPLPSIEDPEGSAVDAQILARYVWLAASRFDEYKNALCLCVADALPAIYAIAPVGLNLFGDSQPMTIERVRQIAGEWVG
jgi:hypothetical protein